MSNHEEAHLHLVHSWVEKNDKSTLMEVLLTHANINKFVVFPSKAHVFDCHFLGAIVFP